MIVPQSLPVVHQQKDSWFGQDVGTVFKVIDSQINKFGLKVAFFAFSKTFSSIFLRGLTFAFWNRVLERLRE